MANSTTQIQADPLDSAALFPIGTLSSRTGVKTVTLRAWERRYGLLKPKRTPKGHRLFSMQDVERVHQILNLLEQGIPVNQVRKILDSDSVLPDLVSVTSDSKALEQDPWGHFRSRFESLVETLDSRSLDRAFSEVTSLYSIDLVSRKLLEPLYHRLQEKSRLLPSLSAEQAFFHEFLVVRLGAACLQNNQSLPRAHKRVLFIAGENPAAAIRALLVANACHRYAMEVNDLGGRVALDALPNLLQRTRLDALVIVDDLADPDVLTLLSEGTSAKLFVARLQPVITDQKQSDLSADDNVVAKFGGSKVDSRAYTELESDISRAAQKINTVLTETDSPTGSDE